MNISAIFWKGQHCIAAPAATNCLLFENVLEKKSLSGVCFFFLKKNMSKEGILIYVFFPSPKRYQTSSVTHTTHGECAQRRVCVHVCHWFVHHQSLFLFDYSTCFRYTWLVLPQLEINFPSLPTVDPTPSFRSFAARLLSCPSCGSL